MRLNSSSKYIDNVENLNNVSCFFAPLVCSSIPHVLQRNGQQLKPALELQWPQPASSIAG
jgi:hypothetical protein